MAGDVVALAIQLTDAGVGDYWDDVDHYFRNGLIEFRIVDGVELERMKAVSPVRAKDSPWERPQNGGSGPASSDRLFRAKSVPTT